MHAFARAKENMIKSQLLPNGVIDRAVLDVVAQIPREDFVPAHLQGVAYMDDSIVFDNGCFLQSPLVLARLVQAARVTAEDIALVIGAGTGYATAVLGRLAGTVVGIEQDDATARGADKRLHDLDICNAAVIRRDIAAGYPEQAPFNVILINGSVPAVPEHIMSQLADGGRLVTIIANRGQMGSGVLITRQGGTFETTVLFDAASPRLKAFEAPPTFAF